MGMLMESKIFTYLTENPFSDTWTLDSYLSQVNVSEKKLTERSIRFFGNTLEQIGETFFFRNKETFYFFEKWFKKYSLKESLSVLHVASSSGEEVYSLAMVLKDSRLPNENFHIDAMDRNHHAINKAKKGIYPIENKAKIPPSYFREYCKEEKNSFRICESLRHKIFFFTANIFDRSIPQLKEKYSVIFCRNLFIYYNRDKKKKIIEILLKYLKKGGLLVVGNGEKNYIQEHSAFKVLDKSAGIFQYKVSNIS